MRKDMSKVIVERPRLRHGEGAVRPGRTRALEDDEGEPLRARAPVRVRPLKTKSLNENLAPLQRFLEAQVGRPWNKVYSEISAHLKCSSTVQQHVRDHIADFVAVTTRLQDGQVMTLGRSGGLAPLSQAPQRLYVHPHTGLVRRNSHWRSWAAGRRAQVQAAAVARAARMREIAPLEQLHLLNDGGWWEVTLAKINTYLVWGEYPDGRRVRIEREEPHVDVVRRAGLSELAPEVLYGRAGVYAVAKRPLNRAEIRRRGLR